MDVTKGTVLLDGVEVIIAFAPHWVTFLIIRGRDAIDIAVDMGTNAYACAHLGEAEDYGTCTVEIDKPCQNRNYATIFF